MKLKAPFPWYGSKRTIARSVWSRLGKVDTYLEPLAGTLAVLLANRNQPSLEVVNDKDCYIANFWRASKSDPDKLAELCDWPVNGCDLVARQRWIVERDRKKEFVRRMWEDPFYYDLQIAGWWCWGICATIGAGWCEGRWSTNGGVSRGRGVVHGTKKKPRLGGSGVHRPAFSNRKALRRWFAALRRRLRLVRVNCGDWRQILCPATLANSGVTGIFFDPPYSLSLRGRQNGMYDHDDAAVAPTVRRWCLEHGGGDNLRIALCGYGDEHAALATEGWSVVEWSAGGGNANWFGGTAKRHDERVWFSPNCLSQSDADLPLFPQQKTV